MEYAYLENGNIVETNDSTLAFSKDRRIKQEHYKGFYISTVFLNIDHSFGGGAPIHFETYVFPSEGEKVTSYSELWGRRAHSMREALKYHEEAREAIDSGAIND